MRSDVIELIQGNAEWKRFLREQPHWYRKLSRNPSEFEAFQRSALHHYQKTIPHQVEKFSNGVQMASMMVSLFQAMNEQQT